MKRIVSVFMAALMAALMFCFAVVPVSAATSFVAPEQDFYSDNFDLEFAASARDYFVNSTAFLSSGFDADDFFISISRLVESSNQYDIYVFNNNDISVSNVRSNSSLQIIYSSSFFSFTYNLKYLSFSSVSYISNNPVRDGNRYGTALYYNINTFALARCQITALDTIYSYSDAPYSYFYGPLVSSFNFVPSDNTVLPLGINVDDWYNWYLSTNDQYLNDLYGYNITFLNINENNLYYLLSYFNAYGVDYYSAFYKHYTDLAPCIDNDFIGPLEKTDWTFRGFYSCLVAHYGFYKKYKSMFIPDVKPNVTEDDTTLITDIDVDTVDISLLREILRTLILTYNSVNDIDYDLSSYIFNMYLKMDDLVTDIDVNFTALRSDLSLHFDSLADKIGISVANNLSPSLNSIDNSVNALVVPLTDIDADLNANLDVANNIDANLEANLQAVNNIDGSVNNLDVSLKEINNSVSGGSGGCCSGSGFGSSPEAPEVPEFDFDTLKDGMGNFLDFFVWVCDHLPPSITVLMGAALSVAIYCRICAR